MEDRSIKPAPDAETGGMPTEDLGFRRCGRQKGQVAPHAGVQPTMRKYLTAVSLVAALELLFAYFAMPDKFVDLLVAVVGVAIAAAIPFIYAALFDALER